MRGNKQQLTGRMDGTERSAFSSLRHHAESQDVLRSLLTHLLPLLRPYRRQQLGILILLCLAAACNVAIPLVVKWFLKDFQGFKHRMGADPLAYFREDVLPIVGALAGIYLFSLILSVRRTQAITLLNQTVLNDLQVRMFTRLQQLPHSFYSRVKLGDIMVRLTGDLDNVQSAISQLTNKSVYQIFMLVGGVIGLLFATGFSLLTLLVLLIVPLFALVYMRLRISNKAASREQRQRVGQTAAVAQEYLSAQAVIKAFSMEERVISAYENRIQDQKRAKLRLALLGALTDLSEDLATGLAQMTLFGVGGYLILVHPEVGIRLEDLVASLLLLKYVIGPVAALSGIGQTFNQASGSLERVSELFEEPLTLSDRPDAITLLPPGEALSRKGHVRLRRGASCPGGSLAAHSRRSECGDCRPLRQRQEYDAESIVSGEANLASCELTREGDLRASFLRGSFPNKQITRRAAHNLALVINDIHADAIESFVRAPQDSSACEEPLKTSREMRVLLEGVEDNLEFVPIVHEELERINPAASRRVALVASLHSVCARERTHYLNAEPVAWDVATRRQFLDRLAVQGLRAECIAPDQAFAEVRLAHLSEGDVLTEAGAPSGFVYLPMGAGLTGTPLGGYQPFAVQPWVPLGSGGVIRGGARNATLLAHTDVSVLIIPRETFLKHWLHPYTLSAFTERLAQRHGSMEETPPPTPPLA